MFISEYIHYIYMNLEQLYRTATPIGNGAHIFVPKDWVGLRIKLVKQSTKEQIIELLSKHLEKLKGIYLFGSYARGEQTNNSDIDILAITSEKINLAEKNEQINLILLQEKDIKKAIEISPILMHSALNEAVPILNAELLNILKIRYKISNKEIKGYLNETENVLEITKSLLEKSKNLSGVAYSLILRLRGLYLINCLKSKKNYRIIDFKKHLSEKTNLSIKQVEEIYEVYRLVKTDKKTKKNVKEESLQSLWTLLKSMLENEKKKTS